MSNKEHFSNEQVIPTDWLHEAASYPEGSPEKLEILGALALIAAEHDVSFIELYENFTSQSEAAEAEIPLPNGFRSSRLLAGAAALDIEQFKDIYSLQDSQDLRSVDVIELVTDTNKTVRVCDLRPFMSSSVQKIGDIEEKPSQRLEEKFFQDIKLLMESGSARNSVTGVRGVNYTKVSRAPLRTYWMDVNDTNNPAGTRTIARLGDCGTGNSERKLYREMFHAKLQKQ